VAAVLPEDQRQAVLHEALQIARGITARGCACLCAGGAALAAGRKAAVARDVLETVRAIESEWLRQRALSLLSSIAPDDVKDQAVEAAQAIETTSVRALALSSYSERLSVELQRQVVDDAGQVVDEWLRSSLLGTWLNTCPKWIAGSCYPKYAGCKMRLARTGAE
jgi:hypothetical protein